MATKRRVGRSITLASSLAIALLIVASSPGLAASGIAGARPQGHRAVGGMRGLIYNAMSIEGVKRLVEYMTEFEKEYG